MADLIYIGVDSLVLLEAALRLAPSGGRAAELGTGTGLSAAVLAGRYQTVVATDILRPIAAVASLTFALNQIPMPHNAIPMVTDVASGLRVSAFDLVIANPPWVPSEVAEGRLFADGGPTGFNLPGRFVWEGAHLLRPGGVAVMLVTDPTLGDASRPLLEMCDHLGRLGYMTAIVPIEGDLGAFGTNKGWETTHALRAHGIDNNRLVTLIIERPSMEGGDSNTALKDATTFFARRWV